LRGGGRRGEEARPFGQSATSALNHADGRKRDGADLGYGRTAHAARAPIKAVAFDAFPIFDPRGVFTTVNQLFPERADALRKAWFARLFACTWLRTTARQYEGFGSVVGQAFDAVTRVLGITATARDRDELVRAFSMLPVWPDVVVRLGMLRDAGRRLVFLSNLSEEMLRANMKRNGIEDFFEAALSTDRVHAFKPSPEAYQLGVDALGLRKEEITFAAFAAWDTAGAGWFGYPSVWINRPKPSTLRPPPREAISRSCPISSSAQASPLAPRASFTIDLI